MNESIVSQKTYRPYTKAFTWGIFWLAILTAIFVFMVGQFSPEGFGRLLGVTMTSSVICGFQANRSKATWNFWKLGGIYLCIAIAILLISSFAARN